MRRMQRDGVGKVQPITQALGKSLLRLGRIDDGQLAEKTNEFGTIEICAR